MYFCFLKLHATFPKKKNIYENKSIQTFDTKQIPILT